MHIHALLLSLTYVCRCVFHIRLIVRMDYLHKLTLHNTYMDNNHSEAQIDMERAVGMNEHNNNIVAYLTDQSHPADVRNILSSLENMNGGHKR